MGEYREFVEATGYATTAEREDGAYVWTGGKWEKKKDASWKNPYFEQTDDHPVVCVSWYDAVAYCNWLSMREGLKAAYRVRGNEVEWGLTADGYRLPTEAEWEYGARGGKESKGFKYAGSNSAAEVGWYNANSGDKMHPVGQKIPNELGIYDMSGNVWEWCWDWYASDYYAESPGPNPSGPSAGESRVLRGGSWNNNANNLRVANRNRNRPTNSNNNRGFRLARTGP